MPHDSGAKRIKTSITTNNDNEQPALEDSEIKRKISKNNMTSPTIEEKYLTSDKGPFHVIFEKDGVNIIGFAKTLNKNNIRDILDIRQRGKNRIRIQFKTPNAANAFINAELFKNDPNAKTFIPNIYTQSIGVITSVPTNIDDEELRSNILAECKIMKIERITRWDKENNVAIPTEAVKIWFRQTTLPSNVLLFLASVRVRHFIPNPVICRNCLRYGHVLNFCKDPNPTCQKCATQHDGVCNNAIKCKYCNEGHSTMDRNCPEYKKQQKIKKVMIIKKKSYRQALEEVTDSYNFPQRETTTLPSNAFELDKLKKESLHIKEELIKCQNVLNGIHQVIAQVGEDKGDNDLILQEIIDTLRGNVTPNLESTEMNLSF